MKVMLQALYRDYERFSSRGEGKFADKLLSTLRFQFGGREEKAAANNALANKDAN